MHLRNVVFLAFLSAVGCSTQPPPERSPATPAAADEEKAVRAQFAALQAAVEKKDADKIWSLMDEKSHTEAERVAKDVQAAYAKGNAEEKKKWETALGLSGDDIGKLTGPGYLKTKRFHKKYDELPESKIEKVVIQGENATVHYHEPDDDHERLIFIRRDGQWKAWLGIPKVAPGN